MPFVERVVQLLQKPVNVLLAWQVVSVCLTIAATMTSLLIDRFGGSLPCLMVTCTYAILLLGSVWRFPRSEASWKGYLSVAALTVLGDYTGLLAYEKTSMASALLFNTTCIFWVPPLAYFAFRRTITLWQGLAILLAVGGGGLIFLAEGTQDHHWEGDLLALAGAICYAILMVTEEWLMHKHSLHLFLFRFSIAALPLGGIFSGAIEWKLIRDFPWCWESVLLIIAYAIALAGYDFLLPFIVQFSDATTMNLSLLTANFYGLGVSILVFHLEASWLYLVGFVCVPIAIVIFVLCGPAPKPPSGAVKVEDQAEEDEAEAEA
jgi:drug/metabolite transporter (DMT)-like permease